MSNTGPIGAPAPTMNFRRMATNPPPVGITPTFLLGPNGSSYMYTMALMYDTLSDAAGYAVRAGLPQYAPPDALQYAGQDRQIFQGINESTTSYINRLLQWLDLWRHAGSDLGVMLAMLGTMLPATPEILCVTTTGGDPTLGLSLSKWSTYSAGQSPFPAGQTNPTPPAITVENANWKWDGLSQPFYFRWMYWRTWVVIFSIGGSPWPAPSATWGSFDWGDGTCYGWAGTAAQSAALTAIAKQWKSAGVWIPWIIVSYDATMFDQTQSFGSAKLPDGHWGFYGKIVTDATYGTVYTSARPAATTCTMITGTNDGGGVLGVG